MDTEIVIRVLATGACAVGAWVSLAMLRRTLQADRGLLREPSIVSQPEARLFFGIPNAGLGIAYYAFMGIAVWRLAHFGLAALIAASLALAVSVYLSYRLVTQHLTCRNCWTAHVVNVLIIVAVLFLKHHIARGGTP